MLKEVAMCSKTHECRKAKHGVNRRHVIALLGALNALSGVASAEPPKQLRRLGVLNTVDEHDPVWQSMHSAFLQDLQQLGWTEGSNLGRHNQVFMGCGNWFRENDQATCRSAGKWFKSVLDLCCIRNVNRTNVNPELEPRTLDRLHCLCPERVVRVVNGSNAGDGRR
jgi:hypothetical protein